MKALAAEYPRFGYRRIGIFLGRDGYEMSPGRAYRLWQAAGLQVPRKQPRKRVAASRPRPRAPTGPNQVRSYDFVFDRCANGQQLKCLTVTDEFTKEELAIDVDGRIRSPRVIGVLSRLVSERGAPLLLRGDNGPEFVSKALLSWIAAQGIGTALIEPGNPGCGREIYNLHRAGRRCAATSGAEPRASCEQLDHRPSAPSSIPPSRRDHRTGAANAIRASAIISKTEKLPQSKLELATIRQEL